MAKRKHNTADEGNEQEPTATPSKSTTIAKRHRRTAGAQKSISTTTTTAKRARATDDKAYSSRSNGLEAQGERRVTRLMTTDAARRAVFETAELLENILLHLPNQDILTSVQRVCRQFNNVVKDSNSLQEKLFFRQSKAQNGGIWAFNEILRIWHPTTQAIEGSAKVLDRENGLLVKTAPMYNYNKCINYSKQSITNVFTFTDQFRAAIGGWMQGAAGTWEKQHLVDVRMNRLRFKLEWDTAGHEGSATLSVDLASLPEQTVDAILDKAFNTRDWITVEDRWLRVGDVDDTMVWDRKLVSGTLKSVVADVEQELGQSLKLEGGSLSCASQDVIILSANDQAMLMREAENERAEMRRRRKGK